MRCRDILESARENPRIDFAAHEVVLSLPQLKGRRLDDEIHEDFIKSFPEYASKDWDGVVNEDEMKSEEGKRQWREFMMRYEKKVSNY